MYIEKDVIDELRKDILTYFRKIESKLDKITATKKIGGEKLYDTEGLAVLFETSVRTIQRYRRSGKLPFFLILRRIYYKESDVIAFMEKHYVKKDPEKEKKN